MRIFPPNKLFKLLTQWPTEWLTQYLTEWLPKHPNTPFFLLAVFALQFHSGALAQSDWRAQIPSLPNTELILLGEQHDAPEHQELARLSVEVLASKEALSALVLEMADAGVSTEGMPIESSEAAVRARLKWNEAGWPWSRYGPIVMQAVRAGVPVVGSNLPRSAMAAVMADVSWDNKLPSAVLAGHRERMIQGHCGLLPESQVPAMARIQVARDERMAQTASTWMRNGKSVLLLAGAEHVKKDRGIPLLLDAKSKGKVTVVWMQAATAVKKDPTLADLDWQTPPVPFKDYCADMKKSMGQK
jgi:uncharacterized iron-regulated protein